MQSQKPWLVWVTLAVAVLAVGLPYWRIPYGAVKLPGALDDRALLLIGALACALVAFGAASFLRALIITAGAVPVAIMLRVIVETMRDPTDHNLWPFELAIGTVVGLMYAVPGAIVGWIGRKVVDRGSRVAGHGS